MRARIALGVVVEVSYAVLTRAWLARWGDPVASELAITAARLATIPIHWILFRDVIRSRTPRDAPTAHPLFVLGIVLLVLAATVPERPPLPPWSWWFTVVFVLTSIVVGVREELVYRGVVQNLLGRRMGWIGAVVVSNAIFVVYHYRKFDFTPARVTTILLVGAALGLVYHRTGSLRLPIAMHTAYDMLLAARPLVPGAVPPVSGTLLQLAGLALLVLWIRRTRPSPR
jgi:membrane protease YdiL (CAAX protease family)